MVIMIELLVVDADEERRADIADALCELPGIEVRATAGDTARALELIDRLHVDAVVTTNDLPSSSIITLIDTAHRRGLTDIIVAVAERPVMPGLEVAWRDLGARHVVDTLPELVERVAALDVERTRGADARRVVSLRLQVVTALEQWAARCPGHASAGVRAAPSEHRTVSALSLDGVLHESLRQLGGVVPHEVQVYLRVAPGLPNVLGIASDIEQLVRLLVRDACSALPLGGNVWMYAEHEDNDHVRIEVLESSAQPRTPADLAVLRALATRLGGDVRVVDLGGPTSIQVTLRAA